MSETNRSTRIKTIGATAAITVGLVAGGAGIAAAASSLAPHAETHADGPHGGPFGGPRGGAVGHGAGTVTAVSPTSLTLKGLDGSSTTYALTSSTTFDKGRGTTATAADVTVGSRVFVIPSTSSSTEAASVHLEQPHLAGTVEKVDGSTITVADEQGFWHTIDVTGSTTYAKAGSSSSSTSSASATDVTAGAFIVATGSIAFDHTTLLASSVSIGLPTPPAKGAAPAAGDRPHHDDD